MIRHCYHSRIEYQSPGGDWRLDGPPGMSDTLTYLDHPAADDDSAAMLRNWTADAGSVTGRWRITLWEYSPGRGLDAPPIASAEVERTGPAGEEEHGC